MSENFSLLEEDVSTFLHVVYLRSRSEPVCSLTTSRQTLYNQHLLICLKAPKKLPKISETFVKPERILPNALSNVETHTNRWISMSSARCIPDPSKNLFTSWEERKLLTRPLIVLTFYQYSTRYSDRNMKIYFSK